MPDSSSLDELFADTMPEDLAEAKQAFAKKDINMLACIMHRIEGGLYYTRRELLEPTQTLHNAIRHDNPEIDEHFTHWVTAVEASLATETN